MVKDFAKLNVSREDTLKICRVIKRAMTMDPMADAISWEMDLEVVQDQTPMDLDKLLKNMAGILKQIADGNGGV